MNTTKEKIKRMIERIKILLIEFRGYYQSLSTPKKVIFICVLILAKLGPDVITYGLILRYIRSKKEARVN